MRKFVKMLCTLSLVFCVVMLVPLKVSTALAYSTGDDYPAAYKNANPDSVADEWNFLNRECTSFAAWCLNSRNGISFHNRRTPGTGNALPSGINQDQWGSRWGHAYEWENAARSLGYTVDNTPAVGSIALWRYGSRGSWDTTGHVAWVRTVYDNGTIDIEEYTGYSTYKWQERNISKSNPSCYLHIKDIVIEERGSYMEKGNTNRELPDGDYMIAAAGNPAYYLDISGGEIPAPEKANVQLWSLQTSSMVGDCDAWTIKYNKYDNDGFYTVTQYKTARALDVSGGSVAMRANVQVYGEWNYSAAPQQWAISKNWVQDGPGKGYRLEARISDYSLDIVNGELERNTNVWMFEDNMSNAQKWLFIPYKPSQPIKQGRYILLSGKDDSFELDVAGDTDNVENGVNVQLWSDNAASQYNSFDVIPVADGYYKLIHVASGKALDVSGASPESAANIQLYADNGGIAQQWAITAQNNGFMLRARCSGYAMDLADGKLVNGQNVRQLFYNGSSAQTWKFVPAEYTVAYNANGGSGAPANQTKYYKGNLTLSGTKPTRTGYDFLGWATSTSATTATFQPGGSYTADANITLHAVWKLRNYQIAYNANGGVNPPATQTKLPGEAVVLSTEKPTRTGYTFLGWARSATATAPEYQPGDTYTSNADLTLYAVWKISNPPTLTGSDFNLLVGDSRSWRDFVTLSHDGVLDYTLRASASGNAIVLSGDQVTAKAVGSSTITVKVVEYPTASCTLSVEAVDLRTMLKLPAALTTIEAEAFENSGIIAVNIPTKCVSIGSRAFASNRGLVYAFIPKSVTDIASDAFAGCPNLIIYCYGDSDAYYYAKSKGIKYQLLSDEWILANEVPLGATVTDEKWTYKKTVTETKTSTDTSMDGWTRGNYTWEKTKDDSYDFAIFPDGFDTGHALYSKYAVPSVPAETKRELGSTAQKSYIYWHWCFIDACAASDTDHNVLVEDARRTNVNISGSVYRDFIYFDAFESTTNYGTVGPGRNGDIDVAPMRYAWRGVLDDASQWWWRFEIKSQSYTDYHKLYSYSRTVTTEESSSTAVVEGNGISNVQHWVKYSY